MNSRKGLLFVCLAGLAAIGCSDRELRPLNPCTLSSVSNHVAVKNLDSVDLLFMIDNSDSMEPKQALIRRELPNMVRGLINGDPGNTGTSTYPKVASLRVGVVTSDMGVAGYAGTPASKTEMLNPQNPNWTSANPGRANISPTPTCGLSFSGSVSRTTLPMPEAEPITKLLFTGTFTAGSTTVTNVTLGTFSMVSRNMLPTLTQTELNDAIVTSLLDTTLTENAGLPVPAGTKVAAWDPAAKTLTLTAAATAAKTGQFTSTRTLYFLQSKANYGDDGLLYRSTRSTTADGTPITNPLTNPLAAVDCDLDGDGFDDTHPYTGTGTGADQAMPAYLTFTQTASTTTADQAAYLNNVVCVTSVGNGGCGFEQQLESIMKAISPASQNDFFQAPGDTGHNTGHGDDPNTNGTWFRQDSLLAIVYVSDEDDCSAADPRVFDPTLPAPYNEPAAWVAWPDPMNQPAWGAGNAYGEINTRCQRFTQFLHDPSRYANGIIAARGGDTSRIVFAAITGIPQDLTDQPENGEGLSNFDAILADSRMQYEYTNINQRDGTTDHPPLAYLKIACKNDTTISYATPGRRVVQVAKDLQAAIDPATNKPYETPVPVFVSSICNDDFHDAVTQILTLISHQLAASCLPRPLNPNSAGEVGCQVLETLKAGETCASIPGRTDTGTTTTDGRQICNIEQVAVDRSTMPPSYDTTKHGWYYDDFSALAANCGAAQPQRISYTMNDAPIEGRDVRFQCLQTITGSGLTADINKPCTVGGTECNLDVLSDRQAFCLRYNLHQPGCNDAAQTNVLFCEPQSNTCQIPCSTDADCPGSFDCYPAGGTGMNICVNPTCGTGQ